MNCKEFEKLIPQYLGDELEDRQVEEFIAHARECSECMEEMKIQYLVTEGMHRLEAGQSMDMEQELQDMLRLSLMKIDRRRMIFGLFAAGILLLLIVGVIVAFVLL